MHIFINTELSTATANYFVTTAYNILLQAIAIQEYQKTFSHYRKRTVLMTANFEKTRNS